MCARAYGRGTTVNTSTALPAPPSHRRTLSAEYLLPSPDSSLRQSSLPTATLALASTIMGGGVLSMPFAFKQAGIVAGLILLCLMAAASAFSLYILVSCSRRIGARSYDAVMMAALGRWARPLTLILLLCLLMLGCVAYMLLVRELAAPIATQILHATHHGERPSIWLQPTGIDSTATTDNDNDAYQRYSKHTHSSDSSPTLAPTWLFSVVLLSSLVALISPLCLLRSVSSLRAASLLSILSMAVLASTLTYRLAVPMPIVADVNAPQETAQHTQPLLLVTTSFSSILATLPILCCCFICHFNVLPLHEQLLQPTRIRVRRLFIAVITIVTVIYAWIGAVGMMYAREQTNAGQPEERSQLHCRLCMQY